MADIQPAIASAIGRSRSMRDDVTPAALLRMAATLGWDAPRVDAGAALPTLWHWLLTGAATPPADLGQDGHERLGLFLPDVGPSVRMWASGDIRFLDPLRVGDAVRINSRVAGLERKQGRTGALWFAQIAHVYHGPAGPALEERQTLVYRPESAARPAVRAAPATAPAGDELARYQFDDLALLRYSALTFNSHRIHFDRRYCQAMDGDDRLVVHGPLLATILAHEAEKLLGSTLVRFSFRALHPSREGETLTVRAVETAAGGRDVWIVGPDGGARMSAQVEAAG